jgi:predicted DNA-binding transcriptional regulator YafY
MIREYKSELELAGIYIESIRGPYGGYYLNQNIKLPDNIDKSKSIPIDNKGYYNLLSKSIINRNKCYIEYYSKEHDKMTSRVIRPYEIIVLDNEWGVAAFCENKQEIRHFYLKRIINLIVLEEKF